MPRIISVSGNIGSGKTTFMKHLATQGEHCWLEGIHDWGELLDLSYKYPDKYSLAFQLRIVSEQTLQKQAIEKINVEKVYTERTSDDGRHVFVNAKLELGHLDDHMVKEFDNWINVHHMGIIPDEVIYIRVEPEVAFERIQKRNQPGDDKITFEYIQMLHRLYDQRYYGENCTYRGKVTVI